MPELPEVETVRRQLADVLPGRTVTAVDVQLPRVVQNATPEELEALVVGRTFAAVRRRGKYLLLPFAADGTPHGAAVNVHDDDGHGAAERDAGERGPQLVVHLRMTGSLMVVDADTELNPYTRVVFALDDGRELRFADVRTFGTIHFVGDGRPGPTGLAALGPEPLADEFTPQVLAQALAGRKAPVKAVLLDQRRVAGLGNIYVDEALHAAGIHPERAAGELTDEEIERLHGSVRAVLEEAVAKGGTTIRDYVNSRGEEGQFQLYLHVYGRAGEPCRRCHAPIERLKVAGRGTHVCPRCQA